MYFACMESNTDWGRGDVLATEVRGHSSTAPNAALHAGQLL